MKSEEFASRANRRVVIQAPANTPDGYGGRRTGWADVYTVWAVIEPLKEREDFVSAQQQARAHARVTIRYIKDIQDTKVAATYQIKHADRLYNIVGVKNLARDLKTEGIDFQQLMVVENQPS